MGTLEYSGKVACLGRSRKRGCRGEYLIVVIRQTNDVPQGYGDRVEKGLAL